MHKKGREYKLSSTGNWILSDGAKKIVGRIERRRRYRIKGNKGQKNK